MYKNYLHGCMIRSTECQYQSKHNNTNNRLGLQLVTRYVVATQVAGAGEQRTSASYSTVVSIAQQTRTVTATAVTTSTSQPLNLAYHSSTRLLAINILSNHRNSALLRNEARVRPRIGIGIGIFELHVLLLLVMSLRAW